MEFEIRTNHAYFSRIERGYCSIWRFYRTAINGIVQTFTHKTIDTQNTHGTGCTLSSAITSFIARGLELTDAIAAAKNFLSQALAAGKDIHIGEGHGPVNHLFNPKKLITL